MFREVFYDLEANDHLHPWAERWDLERAVITICFQQKIQAALDRFTEMWAYHRVSTEKNRTPMRLWNDGLLQHKIIPTAPADEVATLGNVNPNSALFPTGPPRAQPEDEDILEGDLPIPGLFEDTDDEEDDVDEGDEEDLNDPDHVPPEDEVAEDDEDWFPNRRGRRGQQVHYHPP